MSKPAGVSSGANSALRGKKKAGKNVEAFLNREDEIHRNEAYTRKNAAQAYKASWEENQVRKLARNGNSRVEKRVEEELELANKELKGIRNDRLRKFYQQSYQQWEQELNEMGLSFITDRD